jgi:hypothetical protein
MPAAATFGFSNSLPLLQISKTATHTPTYIHNKPLLKEEEGASGKQYPDISAYDRLESPSPSTNVWCEIEHERTSPLRAWVDPAGIFGYL